MRILKIKKKIKQANNVNKKLNSKKYLTLIEKIILACISVINNKGKIIFCGNGGSASDSLHLTAELIGRFKKNRKAISAISLNSEISTLTAVANDYGYQNIFSRQLEANGKKEDLLIAISTSGKSKNILKALRVANKMKIKSVLMTSEIFKSKKKIADIIFRAPTKEVDRTQEIHILVGHLICEELEKHVS